MAGGWGGEAWAVLKTMMNNSAYIKCGEFLGLATANVFGRLLLLGWLVGWLGG